MKKRAIVLIILLAFILTLPVLAYDTQRQLDLVTDNAGLLTEEQRNTLNERAETLSEQYGCEVIVMTVDSLGVMTVTAYAEQVYLDYDFGYGPARSGILLLLSMEARDYALTAYGYGNTVFTDYGKELLEDRFLPALSRNDWYAGLSAFVEGCGEFMQVAAEGAPIDIGHGYTGTPNVPARTITLTKIFVALGIGLLAGGVTVLIMRAGMHSAKLQRTADQYIPANGVHILQRDDVFLRKDVQRVRRDPPSSGGKGGTSVNSRGFSHRSGKF